MSTENKNPFICPKVWSEALEKLSYEQQKQQLSKVFDKPIEERPSLMWADIQHD